MGPMKLSELQTAVQASTSARPAGITVSRKPDPYISPTLRRVSGSFPAEVVFVRAPAAVGKSTTAEYLSSTGVAPLLDLATTPVGQDSLRGLVSLYGGGEGIEAFHKGNFPVIVDALDEGRLLSGEASFEAFLVSTYQFLLEQRTSTDKPKLIMLGREQSTDLSTIAAHIAGEGMTTCILQLDFFDKDPASQLINLYAAQELDRQHDRGDITGHHHSRRMAALDGAPMANLKGAYFRAIEGALGIARGNLWADEKGRTFAGYAPVLASIGTLLASVDNPTLLTNSLDKSGSSQAWDVIDRVMGEILERERQKLVKKLQGAGVNEIPDNAYDRGEQLTYLAQLVCGGSTVDLTGDVGFSSDNDNATYRRMISQLREDHPFIRNGHVANEVLGSTILAYVVRRGLQFDEDKLSPLLRQLSKTPFLWRSVKRELSNEDEGYLDGTNLGYIITSYWNDPVEDSRGGQPIRIRPTELSEDVVVSVGAAEKAVNFTVMPPVRMYGYLRDGDIKAEALHLELEGTALTVARAVKLSTFCFEGNNRVRCGTLTYNAVSADLSGSLWLDARVVDTRVREPRVRTEDGCKYGWGKEVGRKDPWKQLTRVELHDPWGSTLAGRLIADVEEMFPVAGIKLKRDYSAPEDDGRLTWTRRYGKEAFAVLIKGLLELGCATAEEFSPKGERLILVRLYNVPWIPLRRACEEKGAVDDAEMRKLVEGIEKALQAR